MISTFLTEARNTPFITDGTGASPLQLLSFILRHPTASPVSPSLRFALLSFNISFTAHGMYHEVLSLSRSRYGVVNVIQIGPLNALY